MKCHFLFLTTLTLQAPTSLSINHAAFQGDLDGVQQWLFSDISNANKIGTLNFSPLHYAVMNKHHNNLKIVEILLIANANIHAKTAAGLTPLDIATHYNLKDAIKYLIVIGGATAPYNYILKKINGSTNRYWLLQNQRYRLINSYIEQHPQNLHPTPFELHQFIEQIWLKKTSKETTLIGYRFLEKLDAVISPFDSKYKTHHASITQHL